jgi:hypothetical protein
MSRRHFFLSLVFSVSYVDYRQLTDERLASPPLFPVPPSIEDGDKRLLLSAARCLAATQNDAGELMVATGGCIRYDGTSISGGTLLAWRFTATRNFIAMNIIGIGGSGGLWLYCISLREAIRKVNGVVVVFVAYLWAQSRDAVITRRLGKRKVELIYGRCIRWLLRRFLQEQLRLCISGESICHSFDAAFTSRPPRDVTGGRVRFLCNQFSRSAHVYITNE